MSGAARDEGGLPERVARSLVLAAATLGAFLPLGLVVARGADRGDASGVRDALLCALALALGVVHTVRAEGQPDELDSPPARRAQRFAPFAVSAVIVGLFFFPWAAGWGFVTILFFADLPLVAFWHVPRVRAVSLLVATVAALASSVLADDAAWSLLAVGAAWALVPALDRLAAARAALDPRPAPRVAPALVAGGAVLLVGAALFTAAVATLPPTARAFAQYDLFRPRPGARATAPRPPDLPIGTSLLVICASAVTLLAWNAWATRLGRGRGLAPPAGAMTVGAARPLDPEATLRAVAAWPPGPRREVVEAYLRHLLDLEAAGRARAVRQTPLQLAAALARRLAPGAAAAALRLAERFGRARWGPAPVAPEEAARAREEAAQVGAAPAAPAGPASPEPPGPATLPS